MFYIPQVQKDDCGFACLKMVLANINRDKNYLFMSQKEEHGAYSYSDLMKLAKKEGANLEALKVTEKSELNNCTSFPFIASVALKNGAKHAVVVTKIRWKRVYLLDPSRGKHSLPINKFIEIWDGTGLYVQSFEFKKATKPKVEPLSVSSKIGLSIIQIIAMGLAVSGVYFIKDDTKVYIPALFLSLAIIAELILKLVSYRIMKNLDKKYFSNDYLPEKNFKDYIKRYEQYKKLSLSSPMNLLLIIVLSIGLITIVILNDYRNIMLALVPMVLALLNNIIVQPILKNKKKDILQLENSLDDVRSGEELRERMSEIHDKAYNYGYLDIAIRYVYAGLIILSALLTMRICGISSFPFIIFYSCISVTIFKSLDEMLSFNERIEEYNLAKIKMINAVKLDKRND